MLVGAVYVEGKPLSGVGAGAAEYLHKDHDIDAHLALATNHEGDNPRPCGPGGGHHSRNDVMDKSLTIVHRLLSHPKVKDSGDY